MITEWHFKALWDFKPVWFHFGSHVNVLLSNDLCKWSHVKENLTPQKSGVINFPQITQKILTEDVIHWLELITEILGLLQIFSVRNQYIYIYINLHKFIYIINLYILYYIYIYIICLYYLSVSTILCFYFHLLFLTLLATRHILQFTIFDSISLQLARNIMEIKKYFILHDERKMSR